MTAEIPTTGPAWRAAEVRARDFERLGFRKPETRVVVNGKPKGFPEGSVVVVAKAKCSRIIRAGLTGPIQPCGPKCDCLKEVKL
jgi:hypothetical protein